MAQSLYDKAVEESRNNQNVESYSDLLQSLTLMDKLTGKRQVFFKSHKNNDYEHLTALIYNQLATFLNHYDGWEMAIEMLEKSNESFKIENNAQGIAENLELMGDIMLAQSDRTTATKYYAASDSIYELLKNDNIYEHFSMLIHRSINLHNNGMQDSLFNMLHHALTLTEDSYISRRIHYALGRFYIENRSLDSALANYEKSIPLLPRQTTKALCQIVQISNELGDTEKAASYGNQLAAFELAKHAAVGDKNKVIALYERYKSDKRNAQNKNIILFTITLSALLGLLLIITVLRIRKTRRKHQEDEKRHQRIKSELEGQIVQTQTDTKQKEEKIKELEAKLQRTLSDPDFQKQPFDKKMEVLKQLPVCKRVLNVLDYNVKASTTYPELALSENHLSQLVNAVDAVFPKFSVKMIAQYPRLKRSDIVYCCLYLLGINEIQAAALTGKTYQAVWKRSSKLHDIFGNKSDIQFFLQNIINEWF